MPSDNHFDKFVESRAQALGLPIIPEEYREEGIDLAAAARSREEAEFLVALLEKAGVPAWRIPSLGGFGRGITLGIPEDHVGVFVPAGRLTAAQALLAAAADEIAAFRQGLERSADETDAKAAAQQETAAAAIPGPDAAAPSEAVQLRERFAREALRMTVLTFILLPVAPAVLPFNWRLLRRIRRAQQRPGFREPLGAAESAALMNLILSIAMSLGWLLVGWIIVRQIAG